MEQFRQTCRAEFTKEENARMSDFKKWQSKVSATMQSQMEEHRMQEEREFAEKERHIKERDRAEKAKEIQHQAKMRKLDEEIAANKALREQGYGEQNKAKDREQGKGRPIEAWVNDLTGGDLYNNHEKKQNRGRDGRRDHGGEETRWEHRSALETAPATYPGAQTSTYVRHPSERPRRASRREGVRRQ
jgi:hypothetical protein